MYEFYLILHSFNFYSYVVKSNEHCVFLSVFRLDALALSVIATATWLGGWVAVTFRYCIKMAKPSRKLFRPSESPITLVS